MVQLSSEIPENCFTNLITFSNFIQVLCDWLTAYQDRLGPIAVPYWIYGQHSKNLEFLRIFYPCQGADRSPICARAEWTAAISSCSLALWSKAQEVLGDLELQENKILRQFNYKNLYKKFSIRWKFKFNCKKSNRLNEILQIIIAPKWNLSFTYRILIAAITKMLHYCNSKLDFFLVKIIETCTFCTWK